MSWKGFLPENSIIMARKRDAAQAASAVTADLQDCTRCSVISEGHSRAEVMFIGDSPGENEDLQGRPFAPNAAQLLDKMIEAMGLKREQVYIAGMVKCANETQACSRFLFRQVSAIQPKIIVALGDFAAQTLLETQTPINQLRGKFLDYRSIKLMPTFHPSHLLKSPESKKEAWADLQQVAKELGISIPSQNTKKRES
jgi:DNA polymerase